MHGGLRGSSASPTWRALVTKPPISPPTATQPDSPAIRGRGREGVSRQTGHGDVVLRRRAAAELGDERGQSP